MTDTTKTPTGFADLDVAELRRTAVEDFACDITATANKNTVLAALAEDGVTWEKYAVLKGIVPEPVVPVVIPEVVVAQPAVAQEVEIITAEAINPKSIQKFLIKMERENVRFDVRGHKFTKEHPYALVDAADADYILEKEKGFRMARPSEVEEFYA